MSGPARPRLIGYCWDHWWERQGAQAHVPAMNRNYSPAEITGVGFVINVGRSSRQLWEPPERLSLLKKMLPIHGRYQADDFPCSLTGASPQVCSALPFISCFLKTSIKDFAWPQHVVLLVVIDKGESMMHSEVISYCYPLNCYILCPPNSEESLPLRRRSISFVHCLLLSCHLNTPIWESKASQHKRRANGIFKPNKSNRTHCKQVVTSFLKLLQPANTPLPMLNGLTSKKRNLSL